MREDKDCPYCNEMRREVMDLLVERGKMIQEIVSLRHRYEHLMGDEEVRAQPSRLTGLH